MTTLLSASEERGMRVLVTAATRYGATGESAHAIGEVFTERGWDAMVVPPDQVKAVDSFDVVVLGSAVYAGHWLKPASELVDRSGDALAARPVWLFSSGPIGDPPKPEEDPVDVAEILQATKAREHRVFAGTLVRKQLNFPDRAIAARPRGRFPGLGGGQGLAGGDR
jgi:menaquinone-dependent protoporphyrinogen oxidase